MNNNTNIDNTIDTEGKTLIHIPLINIDNLKLWLDSRINTEHKIYNSYINIDNLYISNYDKINIYYNPLDYEISQKYLYYNEDKLNIYSHPNKKIQNDNNNNAVIFVGIKNNTRRFYLDNIFRKIIDICNRENIKDPITGDFLINKNLRNNFYNWSKKYS